MPLPPSLEITAAQLDEIRSVEGNVGYGILKKIAGFDGDLTLRQSVYVDAAWRMVEFCRGEGISSSKSIPVIQALLGTIAASAAGSLAQKKAYELWTKRLLEEWKDGDALNSGEVKRLTSHMIKAYFDHTELFNYVFAEERDGVRSRRDLFVHTAAVPPPLSTAQAPPGPSAKEDGDPGAPAADAAPATERTAVASPAQEAQAAAAAETAPAPELALDDSNAELRRMVEERVQQAKQSMLDTFEAREKELTERVAALELLAARK